MDSELEKRIIELEKQMANTKKKLDAIEKIFLVSLAESDDAKMRSLAKAMLGYFGR